MLALDLREVIAQSAAEIRIRGDDGAVQIELDNRLGLVQRGKLMGGIAAKERKHHDLIPFSVS